MPVNLSLPERASLLAVPGLEIATARAAIRKPGRRDVLLMQLAPGASVAGVFTTNRFCAAPVRVCREHLATSGGAIRAIGKGLAVYDAYDTGLFLIGPSLVAALEACGRPSLSDGVGHLARQGLAGAVDVGDAPWLDVDDARALRIARGSWRA